MMCCPSAQGLKPPLINSVHSHINFAPGWMIQPAEGAGQVQHQPGWGLFYVTAVVTAMSLTAASGYH